MSDSVRPHRWKPTRLPRPWDSPGKNTGVGCHFFLQCMKVKSEREVAQSRPTLSDPMDCSLPGSSVHGIFQARVLEWGAIAFSEREMLDESKSQPTECRRSLGKGWLCRICNSLIFAYNQLTGMFKVTASKELNSLAIPPGSTEETMAFHDLSSAPAAILVGYFHK